MRSLLCLAACFLASVALAADPVKLTLADFTDGNGAAPSGGWSEEDGVIHLSGKGGNLISKLEYENFVLEWDWKVSVKGNNGVKYWVTKVGGKEWLGIEYQMIDDSGHPDGLRGGSHTTASIYDIKETIKEKGLKPAGEWNHSKIVVQDGKIQHWLNGVLAVEADTKTPEWQERIAASKFKSKVGFAPGKGHLMLTDHNDETWFRNLQVTAN
ncbi:MAG: DUF1080 domain-containing protein [Verrucomicrobiae bacterium]|nr:DUF1080 domain-containing protein [Verrucomicrobiae bacterium]